MRSSHQKANCGRKMKFLALGGRLVVLNQLMADDESFNELHHRCLRITWSWQGQKITPPNNYLRFIVVCLNVYKLHF